MSLVSTAELKGLFQVPPQILQQTESHVRCREHGEQVELLNKQLNFHSVPCVPVTINKLLVSVRALWHLACLSRYRRLYFPATGAIQNGFREFPAQLAVGAIGGVFWDFGWFGAFSSFFNKAGAGLQFCGFLDSELNFW